MNREVFIPPGAEEIGLGVTLCSHCGRGYWVEVSSGLPLRCDECAGLDPVAAYYGLDEPEPLWRRLWRWLFP